MRREGLADTNLGGFIEDGTIGAAVRKDKQMKLPLAAAILVVLTLSLGGRGTTVLAQASGVSVTYKTGWNLISAPAGTDLSAVEGPLQHWLPTAGSYEATDPRVGTQTGNGYWAYFANDSSVTLAAGLSGGGHYNVAAGKYAMIGDPSGTLPASVTGAEVVYTYDPVNGYQQTTTLQPGQGAWALSNGVAIDIRLLNGTAPATSSPASPPSGFQTIASQRGYSFQVPADWSPNALPPGSSADLDLTLGAPGGLASVITATATLPAGATNDPIRAVEDFFTGFGQAAGFTNFHVTAPTVVAPNPIGNASGAAIGERDYQANGVAAVTFVEVAVRGQAQYFLVVTLLGPDVTGLDQSVRTIVNPILASLQLAP
jgi:hypothetical protein